MIALLNDKFVPYAQSYPSNSRTGKYQWWIDVRKRLWAGTEKPPPLGPGESYLPLGIVTSTGRRLVGVWSPGKVTIAQGLQNLLDAYSELPEDQRRAKVVEGENLGNPLPPPGALVLDIHDRGSLVRDEAGRYGIPPRNPSTPWSTRIATGIIHRDAQRTSLWVAEEEWKSLIPQNPQKEQSHKVPGMLAKRICLFGLVPYTLWSTEYWWWPDSVHEVELELTVEEVSPQTLRMRVHGSVLMADKSGLLAKMAVGRKELDRAVLDGKPENRYDARLEGVLVYDRAHKRIAKWDMVVLGDYTGLWFGGGLKQTAVPIHLGFSFELDRSHEGHPERCRAEPRFVWYNGQEKYWDPEKWEADWKKRLGK